MSNEETIAAIRAQARAIFEAGVRAADPYAATRTALEARSEYTEISNGLVVLAGGKAALQMMRAALDVVPADKLRRAIAVTNPENAEGADVPDGVELHVGGHPVPDAGGEAGARAFEAAAQAAGAGDLVICLISGGASALLPAPVPGVTLADKITTTEALLKSGADIAEMNVVRTALSRLKGGGLARAAAPARVLGLLLSDVPGDDPATIGSGPTVPPKPGGRTARDIVVRYGLTEILPANVAAHLKTVPASLASASGAVDNAIIGSNAISLAAAADKAKALGYRVVIAAHWLDGDVSDACDVLIDVARAQEERPVAILAGGETTVQVTGSGKGGRNQEIALRFAMAADEAGVGDWALLSGGTDGRDGPTDATGGLVDPGTLSRLMNSGVSPAHHLAESDAYHALRASGDLLMTGATGTNVADLQVLLLR